VEVQVITNPERVEDIRRAILKKIESSSVDAVLEEGITLLNAKLTESWVTGILIKCWV